MRISGNDQARLKRCVDSPRGGRSPFPALATRRGILAMAALWLVPPPIFGQTKKKSGKSKSNKRRPATGTKLPSQKQKAEPPPPPPWPDASVQTLAQAVERLRVVPPKNLTKADLAFHTGLEFCLSLANADGERTAGLVEAVGFQPFSSNAPLPENPPPPHLPKVIREQTQARRPMPIGQAALSMFSIRDREQLHAEFPYMAQWMLPDDFAVVISPDEKDEQLTNWLPEKAALIVRMRGRRATVAGGNFFQTLVPASKSKEVG